MNKITKMGLSDIGEIPKINEVIDRVNYLQAENEYLKARIDSLENDLGIELNKKKPDYYEPETDADEPA